MTSSARNIITQLTSWGGDSINLGSQIQGTLGPEGITHVAMELDTLQLQFILYTLLY